MLLGANILQSVDEMRNKVLQNQRESQLKRERELEMLKMNRASNCTLPLSELKENMDRFCALHQWMVSLGVEKVLHEIDISETMEINVHISPAMSFCVMDVLMNSSLHVEYSVGDSGLLVHLGKSAGQSKFVLRENNRCSAQVRCQPDARNCLLFHFEFNHCINSGNYMNCVNRLDYTGVEIEVDGVFMSPDDYRSWHCFAVPV